MQILLPGGGDTKQGTGKVLIGSLTDEFTIPVNDNGYLALRLLMRLRTAAVGVVSGLGIQFNGDTGSNYPTGSLYHNNATAGESTGVARAYINADYYNMVSVDTDLEPVLDLTIYNYSSDSEAKYVYGDVAVQASATLGAADRVIHNFGWWKSTSPITSIRVYDRATNQFTVDSWYLLSYMHKL